VVVAHKIQMVLILYLAQLLQLVVVRARIIQRELLETVVLVVVDMVLVARQAQALAVKEIMVARVRLTMLLIQTVALAVVLMR